METRTNLHKLKRDNVTNKQKNYVLSLFSSFLQQFCLFFFFFFFSFHFYFSVFLHKRLKKKVLRLDMFSHGTHCKTFCEILPKL